MEGRIVLLLLAVTAMFFAYAQAQGNCKIEQSGCKLYKGDCVCGKSIGCFNPFPYTTKQECRDDINGKNDKCLKHPCRHGECVQLKDFQESLRRWHCECAGTGYYGSRCQHECPKPENPLHKDYPVPCIY